jgi:hypothetical protein
MVIIFPTIQMDSLNTMDVSGRYSEDPTLKRVKAVLPARYSFWAISGC